MITIFGGMAEWFMPLLVFRGGGTVLPNAHGRTEAIDLKSSVRVTVPGDTMKEAMIGGSIAACFIEVAMALHKTICPSDKSCVGWLSGK